MKKSLATYYISQEQYEKALDVIREYFLEVGETHVSAIDMRMTSALAYSKLGLYEDEINANIKILELLKKYDRGELNTAVLSFMPVAGLHPESRKIIVLRVLFSYFNSYNFDKAIELIKEYKFTLNTILPVYTGNLTEAEVTEKIPAFYEYFKQRYGLNSQEYTICLSAIENCVKDNNSKLNLAKTMSKIDSGDDYIALNKLRAFCFEKDPGVFSILQYFINSNKSYEPLYADVISTAMRFDINFSQFIDKTPISHFNEFVNETIRTNTDITDVLMTHINKNTWFEGCTSIKTNLFAYMLAKTLLNRTDGADETVKTGLFELYVKLYGKFLKQVYCNDVFSGAAMEILSDDAIFAYYANKAYELKAAGDYSGFIAGIKTALSMDGSMKDIVLLVMNQLKREISGTPKTPAQTQIDKESAIIKEKIVELINNGNTSKARSILASYGQINPADPDIQKLYDALSKTD